MKELALSKGCVALVDDEDFDRLSEHKWYINYHGYAESKKRMNDVGAGMYLMHRVVMEPAYGKIIDHVDGDRLNNQKSNLRFCSRSQNTANSKRWRTNTTGYKGVSPLPSGKFSAKITVDRNQIWLGRFVTAEEAYVAYCEAAKKYFGEFARFK